jgi:hypothetical protein
MAGDGLDGQSQEGLRLGDECAGVGVGGVGPYDGEFGVHQPQPEEDFAGRFTGHESVRVGSDLR